jgi:hypothetical protein
MMVDHAAEIRAWAETLTHEQLVEALVRADWYQRCLTQETERLAAKFRAEIDALSARVYEQIAARAAGGES